MIPAIKEFFTDETAFVRIIRSGVWALYAAYTTGMLPQALTSTKLGWYVVQFLPAVAFMLGAGDKTPPVVKSLATNIDQGSVVVVEKK